jgi:AraC-like DNA-binding protein
LPFPEKGQKKYAPYLRELKHYMDNHLDRPLKLEDLEKHCHMSKFRICHEFSDVFGLPPIRYMNKKRLEAAENLLLSTEKKVHEIALATGFENTNHFIHLFKKEYGATPQAYREAHQK